MRTLPADRFASVTCPSVSVGRIANAADPRAVAGPAEHLLRDAVLAERAGEQPARALGAEGC